MYTRYCLVYNNISENGEDEQHFLLFSPAFTAEHLNLFFTVYTM